MIVVMDPNAGEDAIGKVTSYLVVAGGEVLRSAAQGRVLLSVVGEVSADDRELVRELSGVSKVIRVSEPFRLASRKFRDHSTEVQGEYGTIGGPKPWIALEAVGVPDLESAADSPSGPRSAPMHYKVAAGGPFDAAVTRGRHAPDALGSLACLSLHERPATPKHPVVFVARGASWGADRWIKSAEIQLARREVGVVLLEQGGEYPSGAKTLEVAAIARAKQRTHLPLVVDVPSVAQQARYCAPVAAAAIGAGADGVILRVWIGPDTEHPRLPATLLWDEAVDLATRLREAAAVLRR